jgi:MFS family permease
VAPTAYSLLSDYFHPNKRALVFAFFSITIYLGELVGLLSAFISQEWSWRVAFAALGLPGTYQSCAGHTLLNDSTTLD